MTFDPEIRALSQRLIYGLTEPDMHEVRYVGRSASGLRRPREHVTRVGREDTYKARWIRGLLACGKMYGIRVLEECTDEAATHAAEIRWIDEAKRLGWKLTNLAEGGATGGFEHTNLELPDAEIVRRYLAGESELALAAAYDASCGAIAKRLRDAGVRRRSGSEANVLRMRRTSPEQRKQNAAAAHAAMRGKSWDANEHSCRVCGVTGHTAKSQKFHPGLFTPGPGRTWTRSAEAIRLGY